MSSLNLVVTKDNFDSHILGRNCGKLFIDSDLETTEDIDETCAANDISAIVLFIKHTRRNIGVLFDGNFRYLTSKVRYKKKLHKDTLPTLKLNGVEFVDYDPKYLEDLIRLSYIGGEKSRYFLDLQFVDKWQEVYKQWVLNAIDGYVDKVIVAVVDGKAIGFIFVKKGNEGTAAINLIAVDRDYQGKNIGSTLTRLAEQWAINEGITEMEVVTEPENIYSQRLYQKHGYVIIEHYLLYSKSYG